MHRVLDPVGPNDRLDLILFSADACDHAVMQAAIWFGEPSISLFAFFQDASTDGPARALFGHRTQMILPATRLSRWGLRLPALVWADLTNGQNKLILEAGFFMRHLDTFADWVAHAQSYDLCQGLHQNGGGNWDCVFMSHKLWRDGAVKDAFCHVPWQADPNERNMYEAAFQTRFARKYRFGASALGVDALAVQGPMAKGA